LTGRPACRRLGVIPGSWRATRGPDVGGRHAGKVETRGNIRRRCRRQAPFLSASANWIDGQRRCLLSRRDGGGSALTWGRAARAGDSVSGMRRVEAGALEFARLALKKHDPCAYMKSLADAEAYAKKRELAELARLARSQRTWSQSLAPFWSLTPSKTCSKKGDFALDRS